MRCMGTAVVRWIDFGYDIGVELRWYNGTMAPWWFGESLWLKWQ